MKICFVLGTLEYSGAEKIVRYLIDELIEDGYEVSVILLSCTDKYKDLERINQIPLFEKKEEKGNRIIRVFKRIRRIRRAIKENSFDLVVSFGVKFNLDVADAMRGTNTKLILCERNDPVNDPKSRFLRLRRKICYNVADGYVFQTRTIQRFFNKKIQRRSAVIPNFIEKTPSQDDCYCPTKKAFATAARLDIHQKDQITLLKAFASFNKVHPEYFLEIYGDGPDREILEKLTDELEISKNVIFYGRVNEPIKSIKKCKAFILSSIYEGMPNALIEAMAVGMPCISTNCGGGGAKELIVNEENGILVEVGNENELTASMFKICENEEYSRKLSKNAYQINEKLEIKKIIKMWEEYFTEVTTLN